MRKFYLLSTLLLTIFSGSISFAQDFSNKGKDFWVAYGYHQAMNGGNSQEMVLYFAADQNSIVTVSIPATGYTQVYNVAANSVVTSSPIPKSGGQDARLTLASSGPENKGIHITSDKAIVAYAHIYNQSVSGASILFPTNTLGKEYYSVNFTNISNSSNSNCWFYVVAADAGNTTVEITPSAAAIGHTAGVPFTVTLTQGQVYNVMGTVSGSSGVDLTGSTIKSINTGEGCKRIGVFSGSGRISITCNGTSSSSDNYMVQAFPKTAWGKKYLAVSSGGQMTNNIYRVCVSNPATVVTVNGAPIAVPLQGGFYYEIPFTSAPLRIEGDNPILVAQYFTSTQNNTGCSNPGPGDPEVLYLSPVEQNISKVLWNATPNFAITEHYFNVVIPNTGTAISSFRLDGAALPSGSFITHPQDANYSYLKYRLTGGNAGDGRGQHTIVSDSGFNAIAYGFGSFESYGYNAGTNIKDIFQFLSLINPAATINFPATCKNSAFHFSMTFPYQPTQIQWVFGAALNALGIADVTVNAPVPTSTTNVGGKTLYVYELPALYSISTVGTYPIKVLATNPTPDGCSGLQDIDFEVQVYEKPVADFNFNTNGCVTNPVAFLENNTSPTPVTSRFWNFGDASTNTTINPNHTYAAPGSYNVKYSFTNDIGCIADTVTRTVTLNNPTMANFSVSPPYCVGSALVFNDLSTAVPGGSWAWNFGDGTSSSLQNPSHSYSSAGNYTVSLVVTSASGCASFPFTFVVTVKANPVADFSLPAVCLPAGAAQFNDGSTVSPGNNIIGWAWNFGDAGTSNLQNPIHNYVIPGPFNVSLTVTSDNGCTNTKTQALTTIYAEPQAAFTTAPEVCLGSTTSFTDGSTAAGSTVAQWAWNFGDGSTSTLQNPIHNYSLPGTYTVTLHVISSAGCRTINKFATRNILVKALPVATITGGGTLCLNAASTNITFTGSGGAAPYTFTYTLNGGANQTVTTVTGNSVAVAVPTNVAGTLTYSLVSVQEGGASLCSQNQNGSVTVIIQAAPTATINGTTEVCLNVTPPLITFTGANGTAPYTFSYRINGGPLQTVVTTLNSNSVTVAQPTGTANTFIYTLENVQEGSTGKCSQNQTGTATIIVKQSPTATIIGAAEVCLNATSHEIIFTGANGIAPYTFSYTLNGGSLQTVSTTTSSNSVSVAVPVTMAATYLYTLVGVQEGGAGSCGQLQSSSVSTTVNPLPVAGFSNSTPLCQSQTIIFTDASVPIAGSIASWSWNFGDGSSSSLQSPVHTYASAQTYTVSLQVTTNNGCVSIPLSKQIVVNNNPVADFSAPVACIADIAAPFNDKSSVLSGNIIAWEWKFGDPNATVANPNTSTLQNPVHHFTVAGPYITELIVTSNTGCRDTIKKTFIVNDIPAASFNFTNAVAICSKDQIGIIDASTITVGTITKVEIFWDYLNDPTAKTTDSSPLIGKSYSHTYPEFGTPASKTYRIRYVAYSGTNCLSSFSRDITLLATPALSFDNVPGICSIEPAFQVTQVSLLNAMPGAGIFSGTGITATGLFNPAIAGSGMHSIRYTYNATNGCSNYIENTIEVYPYPVVNAGPDKVVLEGGQVQITPAQNIGVANVTYLWSPSAGLSSSTILSPVASPVADITYTITVTTDKGCFASDQVFIKVLKSVLIPNIFSPNGDGIHDRWEIPYLESYPGCTIDLYNRYGQLVLHTVGYPTAWDGKVKGKDVPVGTYYYVIDPKNGRTKLSGYVDVIR